MKYLYSLIVLSLVLNANCIDNNEITEENMSFVLAKPDGEVIEGSMNDLQPILHAAETLFDKSSQYDQWGKDFEYEWRASEKEIKEQGVDRITASRILSDIVWDYLEKEFGLIGWTLELNNREPLFLVKK